MEPGIFRPVHAFIQTSSGGAGRLEVLALAATAESDDVAAAAAGVEGLGLVGGGGGAQQQQQQQYGGQPSVAAGLAAGGSGYVTAHAAGGAPVPRSRAPAANTGTVVYPRGPVGELPEEHATRRERFAELDQLQPGWAVELRTRGEGGIIDAVFFSPGGDCVGAYANARRMALKASKEAGAA